MRSIASLALLATLAACGPTATPASAPSPTPPDPKATLVASTPTIAGGTFRFVGKEPTLDETATVDPAGQKIDLKIVNSQTENKIAISVSLEFLVADKKVWLKASIKAPKGTPGLPKLPTKWMLLDLTKVDSSYKDLVSFDNPDPSDVSNLLQGLVSARDGGSGQYTGTIDLTKATDQSVLDADAVTALGDAGKAVPFTATLDGEGRMTAFTLNVPAAGTKPASTYTAAFTDYGSAPALTAPTTGQSEPAPASAYSLINGG